MMNQSNPQDLQRESKEESDIELFGIDEVRSLVQGSDHLGNEQKVVTRFPPEPNGYLHIGHAKSICLNFGIAKANNGECHLRLDDTNPVTEDIKYISSIVEDLAWLGFGSGKPKHFTSDYFDQLYEWAEYLIKNGDAYVDDLSPDEIREYRGTLETVGKESPYRERGANENLELFRKMREGEFEQGSKVLRAKIDMEAGNLNLRDPIIYRIINVDHPRTKNSWRIYPTYDFAHGQSDAIEGITHSLCTLEFEDHRPLYDWLLDHLPVSIRPKQIEFSRLNMTHTVLSKRNLKYLVDEGLVSGWDDPRMPTLSGLRRRGIPADAIKTFCVGVGVTKANSTVEMAAFDACVREYLNENAQRRMAVIDPLKIILENFEEGRIEQLEVENSPKSESFGTRNLTFSREIYIDREDFMEDPPKKFFRLSPGKEVRLRYAYLIRCKEVVKDTEGKIIELRCTYDPETKGGSAPDGRKVKGILHWVSSHDAINAEIRFYSKLFNTEQPGKSGELIDDLNKESILIHKNCKLEPSLLKFGCEETVQFERLGYFCKDTDSSQINPIFNRTIELRDTWSKLNPSNIS